MKRLIFLSLVCSLSFFACGEDDPCEGISCGDRGRCVNGVCECELGYGGADCSTALMPDRIIITNTELNAWPAAASDGSGWDPLDAPDVYLVIRDNVTGAELFSGSTFLNATPPRIYSQDIVIDNPANELGFFLFDHDDFNEDDQMSGLSVNLGTGAQNNDFATTADLDLTQSNGMRVILSLEYEF